MNQRKNKAFLRNIKTKDEGVRVMIRVAFIEKREPVICSECGEVIDWKLVLPIKLYYYKDRNIIANIIDTVECDQQTLMGTSMKMLTDKELSNILDLFDETAAREMANVFKCNGDERVFLRFSTQKTSMDFNKNQEDISDYMLKRLFVVMLVLADIYCFAGLLRSKILFDHIIYIFFLALLLVAEFFFFKIYYKRKYERPFTFILAQAQRERCKNCGAMTATEVDTDLVMLEINENINDNIFGIEPNTVVMHAAVVNYLANQRQGTQSTLTRTEVSGGGKKPWRQKGTGHARQGSTRAPQWTHGGVALGPKPRSYTYSLNKKVKRLALKSALSAKVQDGSMIVVDSITADEFKTKTIVNMLKALSADKALIVLNSVDEKVIKSAANIPGVKTTQANTLNVYDILKYNKFIVVKDAVATIEEVYA